MKENQFIANLKCAHGSEHASEILKCVKPACMGNGYLNLLDFGLGLKQLGHKALNQIQKRFDEFPASGFCAKCQYQ